MDQSVDAATVGSTVRRGVTGLHPHPRPGGDQSVGHRHRQARSVVDHHERGAVERRCRAGRRRSRLHPEDGPHRALGDGHRYVHGVGGGGVGRGHRGRGRVGSARQVRLHPGHDGPQRLLRHQLLDDRLVERALRAAGEAGTVGQLAQDLEPLDGVDAEVGLEVEVGAEHVHGVPGPLADQGEQQLHQRVTAEDRAGRGGRAGGGVADRGGRGDQEVRADPLDDRAQRLLGHQLLDDRLVQRALRRAGEAGPLGQLPDDLQALDGVDAEVGLQIEVGTEHVLGVAGPLADQGQQHGHHPLGVEGGTTGSPGDITGGGDGLRGDGDGCRGGDGRRNPDRGGADQRGQGRRRGGLAAEVGHEDLALGLHQLAHGLEVGEHRGVALGGGTHGGGAGGRRPCGQLRLGRRPQPTGDHRAVRPAHQLPVDPPPRSPGRRRLVDRGGPPVEHPGGVDRDAEGGQAAEGQEEPGDPGLALHVTGQCGVGPVTEDLPDQLGEHPAAAGLDEDPDTGVVHGLDLLPEAHRAGQLAGQELADRRRLARVRGGGGVGEHRQVRGPHVHRGQDLGEVGLGGGHHRGVEGARHRDGTARQPGLLQHPGGLRHPRRRSRDHHLAGAVVVGHHHPVDPVGPGQRLPDGGGRGGHRRHGPRIVAGGPHHHPTALLAQAEELVLGKGPGHRQRHQLAVAVPGGDVGSDAAGRQQLGDGQAGDPEGRLRHPGVGEGLGLGGPVLGGERRRGEDAVGPGCPEAQQPLQRGEGHEQVGQHPGPLAALPRIDEGHLSGIAPRGHEHPVSRVVPTGGGRLELLPEVGQVGGDHGQLHRGGARPAGPAPPGGGGGQVAQAQGTRVRRLLDQGVEPSHRRHRLCAVGPGEQEELGGPLLEPVGRGVVAGVGAQHGVEVGAAEAEGTDPGHPVALRPGTGGAVEDERAHPRLVAGVGLVEVEGRRPDPAVQGQRRLDEPGHPGRALGVADLGLHRPQGDARRVGPGLQEHLVEGGQLGPVTHHRAGAVGLDHAHLGRRDPGPPVGALEGPALSLGPRGGQPEAAPVAGAGDAVDDGVDPIAVALGVLQALEHHAGHALAEGDAVGRGVEAAALTGRRQGVDAGEEEVVVDAVVEVGTAAEDHVAGAGQQLLAGHVDGGQRRGAGGVDRVVDSAEVEPVGDPAGDDVGEDSGERVLVEHREGLLEAVGQRPDRLGVHGPESVGGGQVGAGLGPEDHRDRTAVELPVGVAGVGQGPGGGLQAEQLHRVDGGQRGRGDPVGEGVETDLGDEAAPLRRRAAPGTLGEGVGVVVGVDVPALGRHLGDGVDAGHDVRPVPVEPVGAGEDGRHADDGHAAAAGRRDGRGGGGLPGPVGGGRTGEDLGRTLADVGVQRPDGGHLPPQGGHLAHHEHALPPLLLRVDRGDRVTVPAEALAGDPQASQVEHLELGPHLLGRGPGLGQALPLGGEGLHEGGVHAAGGVTRGGLQQHGGLGLHGGLLEPRLDGPGRHRLLGEQVGGPHQHTDGRPPLDERRGHGGHHGGRAGVVDPPGEQQAELLGMVEGQQAVELGLPEGEARSGTDVAAALAPLEDEPPRPVGQEAVEQARGGDVEEDLGARLLEGAGLGRSAAGDERHRRRLLEQHRHLLLAELRGHEAEDAGAPRAVPDQLGGPAEQLADLVAPQQGEGQEGQPPGLGHGGGELGAVAHPGHRALGDRHPGAEVDRQRRAGLERPLAAGGGHRVDHRPADGLDHAPHRAEPVGQGPGERTVLAQRHQAGVEVGAPHPSGDLPGVGSGVQRRRREVGPDVDAVVADDGRLTAVHGGEGRPEVGRHGGLGGEGQLDVEHDAPGPPHQGGRRGVPADAALGPDREVHGVDHGLEEDEGGLLTDEPAGLRPLGDHPVGTGPHGRQGAGRRGHLGHHPWRSVAPGPVVGPPVGRVEVGGQHQRVHPAVPLGGGQLGQGGRGERRAGADPESERTGLALHHPSELGTRPVGVGAEVEDAEGTRPAGGDDHVGIGDLEGGHSHHELPHWILRPHMTIPPDHRPNRADSRLQSHGHTDRFPARRPACPLARPLGATRVGGSLPPGFRHVTRWFLSVAPPAPMVISAAPGGIRRGFRGRSVT